MAKGINKALILGHVGKDPEIKSTQNGTLVATFSLATANRIKQGEEWVERTEWHNVVAFQRTAEVVRDYVKKGSQLHIEGRIQTRSWDDKDSGQKKYRTEIIVNDLTLLGEGKSGEKSSNGATGQSATTGAALRSGYTSGKGSGYGKPDEYADTGITDDDIPF